METLYSAGHSVNPQDRLGTGGTAGRLQPTAFLPTVQAYQNSEEKCMVT